MILRHTSATLSASAQYKFRIFDFGFRIDPAGQWLRGIFFGLTADLPDGSQGRRDRREENYKSRPVKHLIVH